MAVASAKPDTEKEKDKFDKVYHSGLTHIEISEYLSNKGTDRQEEISVRVPTRWVLIKKDKLHI